MTTDWRYNSGTLEAHRDLNTDDAFELSLDAAVGERVRKSDEDAAEVWGALSNVTWQKREPDEGGFKSPDVSYSFRAAGGLVAAMRNTGCYMDWYCSGNPGVVPEWIDVAMKEHGWTHIPTTIPEETQGIKS